MSDEKHSSERSSAHTDATAHSPRPESPTSLQQAEIDDEELSVLSRVITEKEYEEAIRRKYTSDISPEALDGTEVERDIETGPDLQKTKSSKSSKSVRDPNLVGWEGMDDVKNPKNWSSGRKWVATFVGKS